MTDEDKPLDAIPPAPANLPASEKEPIDFETAKGCVAHYASVAAGSLDAYFSTFDYSSNHLSSLGAVLQIAAKRAYDAKSESDWQNSFKGNRIRGSGLVGAVTLSSYLVDIILEHDKTLAEGTPEDACGTLTKCGLQKLSNGLHFSRAGLYQYMPREREFFSNFTLVPLKRNGTNSSRHILGNALTGHLKEMDGNGLLTYRKLFLDDIALPPVGGEMHDGGQGRG